MSRKNGKKLTAKQFIQLSDNIHNKKYDYSLVVYESSHVKVKIICPIHGEFEQTPSKHRLGHGCIKCGRESASKVLSLDQEEFIKRCLSIHNEKYSYEKVVYRNAFTHILITCPIHGDFEQAPNDHLYGKNGCPSCNHIDNIKSVSIEETKWLNSFNNANIIRQYFLKTKCGNFLVDGYDPKSNTVYEYYGGFWHGNPDYYNLDDMNPVKNVKFRELYNKTIDRSNTIKSLGYNIIEKWGK